MSNLIELINEQEAINKRIAGEMAALTKVNDAIDSIISQPIADSRLTQGKDTGTLNLEIDGVEVKHDLPKRVKWDQKVLKGLVAKIVAAGDNPDLYLDTSYKIKEAKFNAFPDAIKNAFMPARTVETGKAKVSFKILEGSE